MKQSLLISLDCLLDTRLGVLKQHMPGFAKAIVDDPERRYWKRVIDDFDPMAGQGATVFFNNVYTNRNVETLMNSMPCQMFAELSTIMMQMIGALMSDPMVSRIEVVINEYPYDLQDDERKAIIDAMKVHMEEMTPVRFVSRSPEDLTLKEISLQWESIVMYDFDVWYKAQYESFLKGEHRAPRCNIYAPALFHGQMPTKQDLVLNGKEMDPFEVTHLDLREFINVNFWDVRYFSLIE